MKLLFFQKYGSGRNPTHVRRLLPPAHGPEPQAGLDSSRNAALVYNHQHAGADVNACLTPVSYPQSNRIDRLTGMPQIAPTVTTPQQYGAYRSFRTPALRHTGRRTFESLHHPLPVSGPGTPSGLTFLPDPGLTH